MLVRLFIYTLWSIKLVICRYLNQGLRYHIVLGTMVNIYQSNMILVTDHVDTRPVLLYYYMLLIYLDVYNIIYTYIPILIVWSTP